MLKELTVGGHSLAQYPRILVSIIATNLEQSNLGLSSCARHDRPPIEHAGGLMILAAVLHSCSLWLEAEINVDQ